MRATQIRRAVGLGLLVLAFVLPSAAHATFPGENGKIAFNLETTPGGIHVIEPDGRGLERLIDRGWDPAWSADGRRLVFDRSGGGNGLYVANADGSGQTLVRADTEVNTPTTSTSNYAYQPAWSPDGSTIAYTAEERFSADRFCCLYTPLGIRAIAPDGTGDRLLIDRPAKAPAYSPDGTRIAWQDYDPNNSTSWGLRVSNADGSGDTVLIPVGERARLGTVSWSPDSTRIVFSRAVDDDARHYDVHVMDVDGGEQTRLTFDGVNGSPVWSPDGSKIAWIRDRRIWLMNPDGSGQTMLTSESILASDLDWQPLVGPRREDYKNASHFCKALRASLGDQEFAREHGSHGSCVSRSH